MRRLLPVLTAVALAGCGGGSRTAPVRIIRVGNDATGILRGNDPRLNDNSVYQVWTFEGNSGQTVQIDVVSSAFDAFLILQDDAGVELARNDDGGEGTNARLVYTLPRTARYRIIANTYRADAYGPYTVRLHMVGAAAPAGGSGAAVRGTIRRGQDLSGVLTINDPRLSDNSVYHAYLFQGRAGETITVDVVSPDFDAYLIIEDSKGSSLQRDDDAGGGTNARLVFTLPYTGTYRIIANTYREGQYGRYTVRLR